MRNLKASKFASVPDTKTSKLGRNGVQVDGDVSFLRTILEHIYVDLGEDRSGVSTRIHIQLQLRVSLKECSNELTPFSFEHQGRQSGSHASGRAGHSNTVSSRREDVQNPKALRSYQINMNAIRYASGTKSSHFP